MVSKLVLVFLAGFIISGCGAQASLKAGIYDVRSDCPGAETTGFLDLSGLAGGSTFLETIEVPDATRFGFPKDSLLYVGIGKYSSSNQDRECTSQQVKKNAEAALFVCEENSASVCTIFMTFQ